MSLFSRHAAPSLPALRATRLVDQVRERLRYCHYSLSTERSYVYWVRWFVRFHDLRHPRDMGGSEVAAFLSFLANRREASASTHKQALAALLFLYKRVLEIDLPWMQQIGRPRTPHRLPVVLGREEVARLLSAVTGEHQLLFRLLYGTGVRKMEALRLRVKDLDFDRRLIVIREGKGSKDRITMLPSALEDDLRRQLQYARTRGCAARRIRRELSAAHQGAARRDPQTRAEAQGPSSQQPAEMTPHPWVPRPKAGDIVQCRFPEDKLGVPGPKDRPALVIEVEEKPEEDPAAIVRVAYGTSQSVEERYAGELTIRAADPKAGLDRDTKFDLANTVRLPFDSEWFAPSPNRRFGEHPKRGTLNLADPKLKRALQAAGSADWNDRSRDPKGPGVLARRPTSSHVAAVRTDTKVSSTPSFNRLASMLLV